MLICFCINTEKQAKTNHPCWVLSFYDPGKNEHQQNDSGQDAVKTKDLETIDLQVVDEETNSQHSHYKCHYIAHDKGNEVIITF